ncbi:MAG TPA: hypothetical protein VJ600_06505 [Holophagaceae bacterium]|nr:hypothetical protein [Holophagaceae bacterium]
MKARKTPKPSGALAWTVGTSFLLLMSALAIWMALRALAKALSGSHQTRLAWGAVAFMTYAAIMFLFFATVRIRLRAARKGAFGDHIQFGIPIPPQLFMQWIFGPGLAFLGIIMTWAFLGRRGVPIGSAAMMIVFGLLVWGFHWMNRGQGFIRLDQSSLVVSNHWLRYSISLDLIDSIYTNDESMFIRVENLDNVRTTVTLGNGEASPKAMARFDRSVRECTKRRGFPFQINTAMVFCLDPVATKNAIQSLKEEKA